jgi:hypothetical protein
VRLFPTTMTRGLPTPRPAFSKHMGTTQEESAAFYLELSCAARGCLVRLPERSTRQGAYGETACQILDRRREMPPRLNSEPYYFLPAIMNLALRAVRSTCRPRK